MEISTESDSEESQEMMVASEILDAIKANDKQMLWDAIEAAIQMISSSEVEGDDL